jgi:hypothetical protein
VRWLRQELPACNPALIAVPPVLITRSGYQAQIAVTVPSMASYRQPGTVLADLTFIVPLDHAESPTKAARTRALCPARFTRPFMPKVNSCG